MEPRPYCYQCDKAASMCVCGLLRPLDNRVEVHILQHPRERRHPLGTARLLRLGLRRVQLHVLSERGNRSASPPVDLPEGAGLLVPEDGATDLAELGPEDRPRHLVVIDGTWAQANRIFRDNPWVSGMARYRLSPAAGSRYRIRAEPRPECLSTVESVVEALRFLQPDLDTEVLASAFDAMIDAQIEASRRASSHGLGRRTPRAWSRPLPGVLAAPTARVVVVHSESLPGPGWHPGAPAALRLVAVSQDGTRCFDRRMAAGTVPGAEADGAAGEGEPGPEVMKAFGAFCGGPEALVLVTWNARTGRWLDRRVGGAPCLLLTETWSRLSRARAPGLETLASDLGLDVRQLPVPGDAGRRLALAHAMALRILSERDA